MSFYLLALGKRMVADDVVVKVNDVWKVYRIGKIEYIALRGVSLAIRRGEFLSIVGPSGSGKTTFLNIVGALDFPTSGEVIIDGYSTSSLNGSQLAELRNKKIGFVFQSYNLVPHLNALQNVELPMVASSIPKGERESKARLILEQLGLGDKLDKRPNELSGGEQQRVAIARAIVNEPSIILADEPTGNLDSASAHNVANILKGISKAKRVTVIMVTHNMEIAKYSERMIFLRDGSVEREVSN